MTKRTLVTAALPYANGSLHIGHLVEYTQVDMYVRALKRLGQNALYICADDAHGTPIELNAKSQGISPETLVQRYHDEHQRDFKVFDVDFDHFGITHAPTNQALVEAVYAKLKSEEMLVEREMDGMWSEVDGRFLPDRFVRGACPKCGTDDQYGDVCENCGATYSPKDLIDPKSVLSGASPEIRKTTHTFFKLSSSDTVEFLREWINSGTLQDDVKNYVANWVEGGLEDWCITRDGPYFGFPVPDRDNKFFYVWLDAPLGYIAASKDWADKNGVEFSELWQSENTRIEHVIGKDIVYFHTLFWPAVLKKAGFTLPSKVHVHGMLTVDGTKMSKSRGTFINAKAFAEHIEPQALRYYFACKYSASSDDLDLSFDDFILRVNGELVNKHANLFSRAANFLKSRFDGELLPLDFSPADAQETAKGGEATLELARRIVAHAQKIEEHYARRELSHVIRELALVADIGNEFMQHAKPWDQFKEDPKLAQATCTFVMHVCHALAMYLWPIVPRFAEAGARIVGCDIQEMNSKALFSMSHSRIGEVERLFDRIDKKQCAALVEASKVGVPENDKKKQATGKKISTPEGMIDFKTFGKLDLRVGTILSAEKVKKSDKLFCLKVDMAEEEPRQIVAGLAESYSKEELEGQKVVVVANLEPAKIRGVESNGMILAAGEGTELSVLNLNRDLPNGSSVR